MSQIVAASDHAELEAEVSGTVVNRITFDGDRIGQVSRAPGGFPPNAAAVWLGAPDAVLQIVAASDHAELGAEVSGTVVNRITFDGDRIGQVSRAPGGFPPNAAAAWLGGRRKEQSAHQRSGHAVHAPGVGAVVLGSGGGRSP